MILTNLTLLSRVSGEKVHVRNKTKWGLGCYKIIEINFPDFENFTISSIFLNFSLILYSLQINPSLINCA